MEQILRVCGLFWYHSEVISYALLIGVFAWQLKDLHELLAEK